MPAKSVSPVIPLPHAWPSRVKSAILHVIGLAQFTIAYTRGWAADSVNTRVRFKAERDRAHRRMPCSANKCASRMSAWLGFSRIDAHSTRPPSAWQ
jgi:hypothetical protein